MSTSYPPRPIPPRQVHKLVLFPLEEFQRGGGGHERPILLAEHFYRVRVGFGFGADNEVAVRRMLGHAVASDYVF